MTSIKVLFFKGKAWQEIKFAVDNLTGTFNLKVRTVSENDSPFWALDSVRRCSAEGEKKYESSIWSNFLSFRVA